MKVSAKESCSERLVNSGQDLFSSDSSLFIKVKKMNLSNTLKRLLKNSIQLLKTMMIITHQ